jgi:hypothetical protein
MHSGSLDSERWADLDESWRTLTTDRSRQPERCILLTSTGVAECGFGGAVSDLALIILAEPDGSCFLFMVRRDNPSKPMHKNGQSWTLFALTGNPEYVDGELVASLSAIVSRMEQRLSSLVGTIEICGVSRIRMAIYL